MDKEDPTIFAQNGLWLSLYLTSEDIVLNKHKLPNVPNDKPIVCRLPEVFTTFFPPEHDRKLFPPDSENHMIELDLDKLEERLMEEAEKFLNESFDFHQLQHSPQNLIFDVKRNLFWGNEHCTRKFEKRLAENKKLKDVTIRKHLLASLKHFYGLPQFLAAGPEDKTLGFESRFESGNLQLAFKRGPFEYELFVSPDYGTLKNSQWFFFKVFNTRANQKYRFSIVNFAKNDSIFNSGQRLLIYSTKRGRFMRAGTNIFYYSNFYKKKNNTNYSTLSFDICFPEDADSVYISMSFPYTLSKINHMIRHFVSHKKSRPFVSERVLGQTMLGNKFKVLTITNPESPIPKNERKAVLIGSRVHPGETTASFVMQEILEELVQDQLGMSLMRDQVVFYVFPVINPDGVALGNARCNMSHVDLNRNYHSPSKVNQPTLFAMKQFVREVKELHKEIPFFIDIHSHSRKMNCFIYGNPASEFNGRDKDFNFFLHSFIRHCDLVRIQDCNFAFQKEKENCARIVFYREFGIKNCFTLENSFAGASQGRFRGLHFNKFMFESIGLGVVKAMRDCLQREFNFDFNEY